MVKINIGTILNVAFTAAVRERLAADDDARRPAQVPAPGTATPSPTRSRASLAARSSTGRPGAGADVIVTVTPNPGLDLTYALAAPTSGAVEVHRATAATLEASGKGVNVSRALANAGVPTCAVLPAGGPGAEPCAELLDDDGVASASSRRPAKTRINTTALRPGG